MYFCNTWIIKRIIEFSSWKEWIKFSIISFNRVYRDNWSCCFQAYVHTCNFFVHAFLMSFVISKWIILCYRNNLFIIQSFFLFSIIFSCRYMYNNKNFFIFIFFINQNMQTHDFFKLLKNFYFKNREIKNCCDSFYNIIKKR